MCVLLVSVRWTSAQVEKLTNKPARPRTMREQSHREHGTYGPLSPANVPDPCHPRTWKSWTLPPANLKIKQRNVSFYGSEWSSWLFAIFPSFSVARSGSEWLFRKGPARQEQRTFFPRCGSTCGFSWLFERVQWLSVARSGSTCGFSWLFERVQWHSVARRSSTSVFGKRNVVF